jgi:uncharacterized repeat protein (TIGR01451 family)
MFLMSSRSAARGTIGPALALLLVALPLLPAASAAQQSKEQMHDEMRSLASQMLALKPTISGSPEARAAYDAAMARYSQLSQQMGGDDPGHVLNASPGSTVTAPGGSVSVVPPTPAGCGPATTTFTQSTPTAIPTGPAVVSSTLAVAGVSTYLFDLDLTVNLTHTFAADLDITLMSPAGTVVTLTTDNGAGNDNVFAGTLWDDDADADGQVPYVTNAGLTTDHPYVNLTTATPLVPEENFGAFIGEDPNGTWTVTISDDLAGDGGSLASWSLAVTTFPSAPTTANTLATQATPTAIPTGPAVVSSTLVVAGAGTSILDLDLTTNITHTFAADLDITLLSPAGTVVTLTTDNGAGNDNVFNGTVWNDDANPLGQVPYTTNAGLVTDHPYVNLTLASPLDPEEAMAAFIGEDPNGTWTITISDDLAGDGGSLDSWTLDIDTFTCGIQADLQITKTDGVAAATPGGSTTYTIVASNAGPGGPVIGATVADTFPAACTSVSYTSVAAGGATGNTIGPAAGNINDTVDLPAGSSITYTATCTIDPAAVGTLDNTATITAPGGVIDPNLANNSATDSDTLGATADLSLTKTANPTGPVNVGNNIVYTLTVTNNGPSTATGVVVTDILPANTTYVSNSCGAAFAAGTVTWNVGSLAPAAAASCDITVTVTAPGAIVNTATATSTSTDPTPGNNSSTITGQGVDPAIPTLSGMALLLLVGLFAGLGVAVLRRVM